MAPAASPRSYGFGRYTRIVRLLRWVLPSCALVLGGLLVAWPSLQLIDVPDVMPVEGLERPTSVRSTMINVRFLGTDHNGLPFTIRASSARHESGDTDRVFLERVSGSIAVGREGQWTSVAAEEGLYDQAGQVLTLESGVTVVTSDGYRLESQSVRIDLEKGTASSDTLVRGTGPSGILDAKGFEVTDNGGKFEFIGRLNISLIPDT